MRGLGGLEDQGQAGSGAQARCVPECLVFSLCSLSPMSSSSPAPTLWVCALTCVRTHHSMCVEAKRELVGIGSLFPTCRYQLSNSGILSRLGSRYLHLLIHLDSLAQKSDFNNQRKRLLVTDNGTCVTSQKTFLSLHAPLPRAKSGEGFLHATQRLFPLLIS